MGTPWNSFWHSLTNGDGATATQPLHERRKSARVASHLKVIVRWEVSDSELRSATGSVREVSDSGMSLACEKSLPRGQTVWVMRKSAPALKAIVRHCVPEKGLFNVGLAIVVNERRRADRLPSDGEGVLTWVGDLGERFEVHAKVSDLVGSGMQLVVDREIPTDIVVRLVGERVVCVGAIQYCRVNAEGETVVGFQFVQQPYAKVEREALDLKPD